eukprot:SM000076S21745  [mRNA]  locus=s76:9658:13128:- [translate_table: standard]
MAAMSLRQAAPRGLGKHCHCCRQKRPIGQLIPCGASAGEGGAKHGPWCHRCIATRLHQSPHFIAAASAAARDGSWKCPRCYDACPCNKCDQRRSKLGKSMGDALEMWGSERDYVVEDVDVGRQLDELQVEQDAASDDDEEPHTDDDEQKPCMTLDAGACASPVSAPITLRGPATPGTGVGRGRPACTSVLTSIDSPGDSFQDDPELYEGALGLCKILDDSSSPHVPKFSLTPKSHEACTVVTPASAIIDWGAPLSPQSRRKRSRVVAERRQLLRADERLAPFVTDGTISNKKHLHPPVHIPTYLQQDGSIHAIAHDNRLPLHPIQQQQVAGKEEAVSPSEATSQEQADKPWAVTEGDVEKPEDDGGHNGGQGQPQREVTPASRQTVEELTGSTSSRDDASTGSSRGDASAGLTSGIELGGEAGQEESGDCFKDGGCHRNEGSEEGSESSLEALQGTVPGEDFTRYAFLPGSAGKSHRVSSPSGMKAKAEASLAAAKASAEFGGWRALGHHQGLKVGRPRTMQRAAKGAPSKVQLQINATGDEAKLAEKRKRKAKDLGLTPAEVVKRRKNVVDATWVPPVSPFGLIQEKLYREPWRLLVACMLLNKTAGQQMYLVIWELFELCPTPEAAVAARTEDIGAIIYRLGLQNKRAHMIQQFSADYIRDDWTEITQLHGIGKYAADSHAIFCEGRWREVTPDDHMLDKYWTWLHQTQGQGYGFSTDI